MRRLLGTTRRLFAAITAIALATLGVLAIGVTPAMATTSVENNCMATVTPTATFNIDPNTLLPDGTASLTWSDECSNVINNGQSNSYYNIEVSTDGGATWTFFAGPIYTDRLVGSPGQNGAVNVGAVDACTSYTFRVVAVVETGQGNHVVTSISKKSNTLAATGTDCGGGGGTGECSQLSGAFTLGYYSNKNGQAILTAEDFAALTALNLRNATGSDRDFTGTLSKNKSDLKSWLLSATATNMVYMLSAQLATLEINLDHNFVSGDLEVCEFGNETIDNIVADADAWLSTHTTVYGGNPDRPYGASLETIIDEINNNVVSVI